jgi:glycosyltransferase involved in cell wall biosynthesis/SAM-dependent methyltransferase
MKIAIDVSLVCGESAGVGSYVRGLLEGLRSLDLDNEYILFSYLDLPQSAELTIPQAPNFALRRMHHSGEHWERIWSGAALPPKELLEPVDLLHSPFFNAPKEHHGALVVTIHDIAFLRYPQFHTEANRLHCLNGTLQTARYADRIIAVSHHTKKELMDYFAISADRIRVIHEAPRKVYYPERDVECIRKTLARLGIYQDFILVVGSYEPRKNLQNLLEAYAMHVQRYAGRELLVVAGGAGWLNEGLASCVADLGVGERVRFVGYLQESDLRVLYSAARLFVYPSFYEGFGLPPLEAMACGAPVITSNTSSLPEVVGDAAILIDPHNAEEICQAMRLVLSNGDLRAKLRQQSLQRAKRFSWERVAKETLAVYEEICPEHYQGERAWKIAHKIQESWDWFGKNDPFWAALTHQDKKNGAWSEAEFFETGRQAIRAIIDRMAAHCTPLKYGKALDFGCGPGRLTQALAEYFQEVHGVDIAPSMITKARELNQYGDRCIYHLNDTPDLGLFDTNTFDMVCSWVVLQHIPKQLALAYIAEFVRIIKPGGVIVFELPDRRQAAMPSENSYKDEIPFEFWRAEEPLMLMGEIPYPEVVKALETAGAHVLEVEEDTHADQEWVVCYYVATKG